MSTPECGGPLDKLLEKRVVLGDPIEPALSEFMRTWLTAAEVGLASGPRPRGFFGRLVGALSSEHSPVIPTDGESLAVPVREVSVPLPSGIRVLLLIPGRVMQPSDLEVLREELGRMENALTNPDAPTVRDIA